MLPSRYQCLLADKPFRSFSHLPELRKIRRSTDFEALKLGKGSSGRKPFTSLTIRVRHHSHKLKRIDLGRDALLKWSCENLRIKMPLFKGEPTRPIFLQFQCPDISRSTSFVQLRYGYKMISRRYYSERDSVVQLSGIVCGEWSFFQRTTKCP